MKVNTRNKGQTVYLHEVFRKLFPTAIYYGMSPTEFNESCHSEIMTFIIARKDAERNHIKNQILLNAELVEMISHAFNGKQYNVMAKHPDLFVEELRPRERDWEQEKASIMKVLKS